MPNKIALWSIVALLIVIVFASCQRDKKEVQFEQFYAAGQLYYKNQCTNCHAENGMGIGKLYPPLANSDYLMADKKRAACIVRYGLQGPVEVNGTTYNLAMPANSKISTMEIAQILTYVQNAWGNEGGLVTEEEVKEALKSCDR